MRRVNIITGINQRIHDMIGQGNDGDLNDWSAQSCMLENFLRVGKALSGGSSVGKVLTGLNITPASPNITIGGGVGATLDGNIIYLPSSITYNVSAHSNERVHFCLQHGISSLPTGYGKETSLINESGKTQIVFDDLSVVSAILGDTGSIAVVGSRGEVLSSMLYVGTVVFGLGGSITGVTRELDHQYGQVSTTAPVAASVSGSWTLVPFSGGSSALELDTGVYTAKSDGYRNFSWKVTSASSTGFAAITNYWKTGLFINSVLVREGTSLGFYPSATTHQRESVGNALIYMDEGDTAEIKAIQNTGSGINWSATAVETYLSISTQRNV